MGRTPLVALLCATAILPAGCGSRIHGLYEASREAALADPGPLPEDWAADAVLGVSWTLVDALLEREVEARVADGRKGFAVALPLGAEARVTPDVEVTDLDLGPGPRSCPTCARLSGALDGTLGVVTPLGRLETPVDMRLEAVVALESRSEGATLAVEAVIRDLQVRLPRQPEVRGLDLDLGTPLARWAQERVGEPRVTVAELGTTDTPVRAVRLLPRDTGFHAELRTSSPTRGGPPGGEGPAGDWSLEVTEAVLLGLARRAAFTHGEVAMEVYADPRGLDVEGDRFTLDLRLWRLAGRGWWRDYQVEGHLSVEEGRLRLVPDAVAETGHSPGAGLADPLAALGRGFILGAIEDGLRVARPARSRQELGAGVVTLTARSVTGQGDTVVVRGDATLQGRKARGKRER